MKLWGTICFRDEHTILWGAAKLKPALIPAELVGLVRIQPTENMDTNKWDLLIFCDVGHKARLEQTLLNFRWQDIEGVVDLRVEEPEV